MLNLGMVSVYPEYVHQLTSKLQINCFTECFVVLFVITLYFRYVDRYGFYETVDIEDEDALLTYSEKLEEKSSGDMVCSCCK